MRWSRGSKGRVAVISKNEIWNKRSCDSGYRVRGPKCRGYSAYGGGLSFCFTAAPRWFCEPTSPRTDSETHPASMVTLRRIHSPDWLSDTHKIQTETPSLQTGCEAHPVSRLILRHVHSPDWFWDTPILQTDSDTHPFSRLILRHIHSPDWFWDTPILQTDSETLSPDWLWNTPSLLHQGYWSPFPESTAARSLCRSLISEWSGPSAVLTGCWLVLCIVVVVLRVLL